MPHQRPVLVANWKMNHGPSEARGFAARFITQCPRRDDRTLIFCPPAVSLEAFADAVAARDDITVGAQNIWTEDKGAFTGENSGPMARDAGATWALVGHSERRHVFGETDEETGKKCAAAARAGLTPMLCVGELLEEREHGATIDVVLRQLRAGLANLSREVIATMAVAYEPVWAIGTGRTATPADAAEVHARLRAALRERIGAAGNDIPILYGGSVNLGNARALLDAHDVNGLLVGGASLDADNWAAICAAASKP